MDLAKTYDKLQDILKNKRKLKDGMNEMIDFCENLSPHRDWKKLKKINYLKEVERLKFWLKLVLEYHPIPKKINGLWFGIYQLENRYDFYISGNTGFNEKNNQWACNPKYCPDIGIAKSKILKDIYTISNKKKSLGNDAEYPLCLTYTSLIVRDSLADLDTNLLFKKVVELGIFVGFDSGDFISLGIMNIEDY